MKAKELIDEVASVGDLGSAPDGKLVDTAMSEAGSAMGLMKKMKENMYEAYDIVKDRDEAMSKMKNAMENLKAMKLESSK